VNATPVPTEEPEIYDVEFEVTEQNTGQFQVGAGFSSIDALIGYVQLQKENFDLYNWPPVGGGQSVSFRGTLGTKRQDIELDWADPWFLNRRLYFGAGLFRRESRFFSDEYDQRNTGGRLRLGFRVAPFTRLNLTYGLEEIRVYNVDEDASDLIKAEEGRRIKSSLTPSLRFDTRDNPFVPTRGMRANLAFPFAGGPLQGETDIYGAELDVVHYWPIWFEHVFMLRGAIGGVDHYGDSDFVPIFDRLFLGGARTLRGFDFRDVGPKDETGEPIGGGSTWYATAEYTIPLADQFRLAGFYDIGMVHPEPFAYDFGDYNSDVGVGLRIDIPGFPLRLDYAWPLEADDFNDRSSGRFQFSLGYAY
jgi:outer membrane protein insertion porin family